MKKLFTILCAGLLTVSLSAQTDAGTFLLDGATGLGFANQSVTGTNPTDAWNDDDKSSATNLELNLMGGYFLADGLVAGLSVGYASQTSKFETSSSGSSNTSKVIQNTMMIAPTVRYYIGETGVWGQASYGFGSVTDKSESEWTSGSSSGSSSSEVTRPMSALSFGAGYAIYLSDYVSLNPFVGYALASVTEKADQNNGYGYYNANTGNYEDLKTKTAGLNFALGLAIHLD